MARGPRRVNNHPITERFRAKVEQSIAEGCSHGGLGYEYRGRNVCPKCYERIMAEPDIPSQIAKANEICGKPVEVEV